MAIPLRAVRRVTAQEAAAGIFSIYDVVLPLPGSDVTYPSHVIGELIEKYLAYDGLQNAHSFEKAVTIRNAEGEVIEDGEEHEEMAAEKGTEGEEEDEDEEDEEDDEEEDEGSGGFARWPWHETNEYRLPGAYRRLMIRPGQWTHKQVEYSGYTELLRPLSELDKCSLLEKNERSERNGVGMVRPEERRRSAAATAAAATAAADDAGGGAEGGRKRRKVTADCTDGRREGGAESSSSSSAQGEGEGEGEGGCSVKRRGLVCEFSLPPGTYATMLFRELQKDGRAPRKRLQQHVRFGDGSSDED